MVSHTEFKELRADARCRALRIKRKEFELSQARKSFKPVPSDHHYAHKISNPNRATRGKVRTVLSRGILEFGADLPRVALDRSGARKRCAESFILSSAMFDDAPSVDVTFVRSVTLFTQDTRCMSDVSQFENRSTCSTIKEDHNEVGSLLSITLADAVQDVLNDDVSDWELLNEHLMKMCDEEEWVL